MINSEPVDLASLNLESEAKASHLYRTIRHNGQLLTDVNSGELEKFKDFQVYDDDIWLCSFPKSGTTWVQEMIWSILYGFEDTTTHLGVRFPMIDYNFLIPNKIWNEDFITLDRVAQTPRPRFIKMHLAFDLWPRQLQQEDCKAKIIFVTRNPRDACISYYHQQKSYLNLQCNLEEYAELFIKDLVILGPYWKSMLSFWNQRHRSNVHFVRYEDMKKNLSEEIHRMSEFLDKPLSEARISQLCDHLHFDAMKLNPLVNAHFKPWKSGSPRIPFELIRVGKVNQWKTALSEERKKDFEKWERENLKDTDYPLDYDELSIY